ncbi:hypothetical protein CW731_05800 [Polaribacter sp. ALD11]|uniref:hypothetical protein n=1 Tax=Polaribacter sp. ALD11 TaxID=2058137 RepID=UPI000C306CCA|nr:hypothetical protein [Polaribacter sp. ALD11]AUC84836.1 hypothetical protein CW731_05800 [Polaribacter sp. ALD11]
MKIFNDFINFYNNQNSEKWNFAENYVPEIFESKFIVHWIYGIIENFPFEKYPLKNETFEDQNKRVKIEKEFNVLLKKEELYKPVSIKFLSEKFNVEYSQKTVELIPENPGVHYLENLSINKLKESLERLKEKSKLNLLIYENEEYNYRIEEVQREYENIGLEKYFEIQELYGFQLDTCLFEENLNWCLVTAEDVPILLGCKKDLESEIEQKMNLELFKIENKQEMY